MIDLNHLRVFERVASLRGFSAAARELGLPKSSVSRAVSSLEAVLGTRLVQRTTRDVALTPAGSALHDRARSIMADATSALDYMSQLSAEPAGPLRVSAGVGLGINVLSRHLPEFLRCHPRIELVLHLESAQANLLSDGLDAAIRFGQLADSSLVAQRLGALSRVLCAAPSYLAEAGTPLHPRDLGSHRLVDMPAPDGRPRHWSLTGDGATIQVQVSPVVAVDEVLTIHGLLRHGAGIGVVSGYLCEPDFVEARLVRVLPDWSLPVLPVSLVFPSRRELAPAVRAFAGWLREIGPLCPWAEG